MKSLLLKGLFAVVVIAVAIGVSLWQTETPKAVGPDIRYPPLHAGIGSPGAIVSDDQPENPEFFALVKTDWLSLNIDEPRTAWEFVQRGLYYQDDLEDVDKALEDYLHAEEMLEEIAERTGDVTLPERMLHIWFRTGIIYLHRGMWEDAIHSFEVILEENPEAEGIHREIALAYEGIAHDQIERGEDPTEAFEKAYEYFEHEFEVAPNNQLTLYDFGLFLQDPDLNLPDVDQPALAREMYERYLDRAANHCDTYPTRVMEVVKKVEDLGGTPNPEAISGCIERQRVK